MRKDTPDEICAAEIQPTEKTDEKTIWVPAWHEVIRIVPDSALTEEERLSRLISRAQRIQQSPTPEAVSDVGVILTLIDDIQDFTTAVGVFSRLLAPVSRPADMVARGSFATGDLLNQMNLLQRLMRQGDGSSRALTRELRAIDNLPPGQRAAARERILRRHGIDPDTPTLSLRSAKRLAENMFRSSPGMARQLSQMDRRMARMLPTAGEIMEVAQTSEMITGVGLSFGPLVGLITDLAFGLPQGVEIRVACQAMSEAEREKLKGLMVPIAPTPEGLSVVYRQAGRALEAAGTLFTAPEVLLCMDQITAMASAAGAFLNMRCARVKYAMRNLWEGISSWVVNRIEGRWNNRNIDFIRFHEELERRRQEIRNPHPPPLPDPVPETTHPGVWPVRGLGRSNTLRQIQEAYLKAIQPNLTAMRKDLDRTMEGAFFDFCMYHIARSTCTFLAEEGSAIKETFAPELVILTRSIDLDMMVPADSTDEEYREWTDFLKGKMEYYRLDAPTRAMFLEAERKIYLS